MFLFNFFHLVVKQLIKQAQPWIFSSTNYFSPPASSCCACSIKIDILEHGRRCGQCHCLDFGGALSIPLIHFWYHLSRCWFRASWCWFTRAVCVLCEPPARLPVYPSSPPQPSTQRWVSSQTTLARCMYMVLPNLRRKLRTLSAKRASEPASDSRSHSNDNDADTKVRLQCSPYTICLPCSRLIE